MGLDILRYDPSHRVVVCRLCGTCLVPKTTSWRSHLRAEPHRMRGEELRTTIELLSSYDLRSVEELRQWRPGRTRLCRPIEGLAVFAGYYCCTCDDCNYCTRRLAKMHQHMPAHGMKASQHREAVPLWRGCKLQTYFTAKGRIDYFVVEEPSSPPSGEAPAPGLTLLPPSQEEGKLFDELKADVAQASRDLEEQSGMVQDAGESRADRVPWLVHTGFPAHMRGLRDAEIQSSYSLPAKKVLDGDSGGEGEDDPDLIRMLVAAEAVLRDAYKLCSDKSLERKMTQQRAKRLNEFRDAGGSSGGKPGGFRSFKNESSLTSYFRRMKQLLAYYYRVVLCEDGHFTRENEDQVLPRDVIEPTPQQQRTMEGIVDALRRQDERAKEKSADGEDDDEGDAELKHAIRNFYVSLICQTVGSRPFRSAVLSFCAMLSRKKAFARREANGDEQRKRCVWHEPGNFNSNLSALTWTAQLILFDFVCFHKQEDEDGIPELLEKMCKRYFQQMAETPFGHILQWRLYLFAASRTAIAKNQARWSLDGQTIDYLGTRLHMEQVSQLVVSEFRQAHSLLYDELLFGAKEIAPVEAWRLHDDLDLDDYGGSWLTDDRNAEILKGTQDALLRQIEHRAELRGVYVRTDQAGGLHLCPKATACYEAHVQELLRRMVTLIHVSPAPPLRAPELLSVTYTNTGRRRCILIWEKMVMVYVRYHKSQEQVGAETENIRFLPRAIGDLLLTYLALVPPLRQVFLRQRKPGALLSPYLWSSLDGEVWRDTTISSCLRKACARAEVPQFQVAWWRQVAASITKEKFGAKERANFDLEEIAAAEEVEDEAALADLAGMSNHSYRTFNHAYAGSTTLTMSTLLHRAYRASQSWRSLFRFDQLLQGKRPHTVSETQAQGLLDACKKARFRTRPTEKEDGLLTVARRLYNDPGLQLRRPGQRDGMLATLGPRPAEQVIVVLATGSGKTLIVLVGAALEGAATTILILPTVALRGNMLVRLGKVGLKHYVWSPGSSRSAPLVIISAEAACTESFLEYANRLADRQRLDRIVVDECHLTITASDYRRCMSQLGWYVRRVQTQTIWLTATLPPDYQELFIEHNKLVRPHMVRESTNRPNIRYIVRRERGLGALCQRAARLVQTCWTRKDLFESERDKIILYCQTKELVTELAGLLGCPSYTADSGTEEEKRAVIEQWLSATDPPAVVATSALGPGFDHPHVRCVIHVDAPNLMTDFSQESGRAGRDGKVAESIVLLSEAWQPQLDRQLGADQEAMQLYLTQQQCSRAIMSQFLDVRSDWRWCMEGDELCGVCPSHHLERRPTDLEFHLPQQPQAEEVANEGEDEQCSRASEMVFTGPGEVLRQARVCNEVLSRYERDLETMMGCCLYCRVEGKTFEHAASACARRHDWIRAKQKALRDCKGRGKEWMDPYAVCWMCYQPQEICRAADPDYDGDSSCRFPDMVMPLCFGAYSRPRRTDWFLKHFNLTFGTCQEYMLWLGKSASLGGSRCTQANCVAALLLAELG